jgi:ADP-ribose pyrophosphatase
MTEDHLKATVSLRGVIVAPDEEVLIVARSSDGDWELPGGRLGTCEDAIDGVHREIVEETGLDATVGQPIHAVAWRNEADCGRFAVYYDCTVDSKKVQLSHEHTDALWLSPTAAKNRVSEDQRTAINIVTNGQNQSTTVNTEIPSSVDATTESRSMGESDPDINIDSDHEHSHE